MSNPTKGSGRRTKPKGRAEQLEERNAELEAANQQLKEQLVDSMRGEIEARRKLEAVRDYVGQMQQMAQVFDSPDDVGGPGEERPDGG